MANTHRTRTRWNGKMWKRKFPNKLQKLKRIEILKKCVYKRLEIGGNSFFFFFFVLFASSDGCEFILVILCHNLSFFFELKRRKIARESSSCVMVIFGTHVSDAVCIKWIKLILISARNERIYIVSSGFLNLAVLIRTKIIFYEY